MILFDEQFNPEIGRGYRRIFTHYGKNYHPLGIENRYTTLSYSRYVKHKKNFRRPNDYH
jgi:hypothetical protein